MQLNIPANSPLDHLLYWADRSPDDIVLKFKDIEYSFAETRANIEKRAFFLRDCGVVIGSKCALYSDDEEDFVFTLYALWLLGAVAIPLNISQKADKLRQIENSVQPDLGFYSANYKLGEEKQFPIFLLGACNSIQLKEKRTPKPDDLAIIMFTSGTSGVPKAVPITHRSIANNTATTAARLSLKASDKILVNTPPYTTSSIIHLLTMVTVGASTVIDRSFMFGSSVLDQIKDHCCTGFGGVPVHFSRLVSAAVDGETPGSLRFLINSGDHLPVPVAKKIAEQLPNVRLFCMYGLTEVAGRLCILPDEDVISKCGSVGFPLEGMTVTVRDSKGELKAVGEQGQVYVDGPNLMTGYLNNQDANEKSMTPFGFATGDYGYLDKDGYLYISGRSDDIFKVGGEKVSAKMIEDVVIGLELFKECIVVAEYDDHMGNVPCLYYVPEKNDFSLKQLRKSLKGKLPHTHIPTRYVEVESIPRTSSGKLIRKFPPPNAA